MPLSTLHVTETPLPDSAPQPYRLDATVELKQPPEADKGIDWLAWMQASTPVVLALVGLYFTDTVRTGFERQQLQLANASGMQTLLVQLLGMNTTQAEARAAASTLASFGPPAVAPLVTALTDADDVRTPAIEAALRAIGLNNADAVCGPLMSILERQSGRYSWLMYRSAIRVVGDVRCPRAQALLQAYAKALADGTLKTFDPERDERTTPSDEIAEILKADVNQALTSDAN
jgi:hypothetical protein